MREVEISGRREGLLALAASIIALANSRQDTIHVHLEQGVSDGFRSSDGFVLTLTKHTADAV